jgi:hypothetical protein
MSNFEKYQSIFKDQLDNSTISTKRKIDYFLVPKVGTSQEEFAEILRKANDSSRKLEMLRI